MVGQVLPGRGALQDPGRPREEPDLVHQRRQLLGHGQPDRLAGVAALGGDDLLAPRLDRVGQPEQGEAALRRGGVPPSLLGGCGCPQRRVHVRRAGDRGPRVRLAGARVDDVAGVIRRQR